MTITQLPIPEGTTPFEGVTAQGFVRWNFPPDDPRRYVHWHHRDTENRLVRLLLYETELRLEVILSELYDERREVPRGHEWHEADNLLGLDSLDPVRFYAWGKDITKWSFPKHQRADGRAFYEGAIADMEYFLRQIVVDLL